MAIRNVVQVGDDVLRKKCFPVEVFDEKLHALLDDMKETVKKEQGAGLAAPQVGVLRRIAVIEVEDGVVYEMINPEIIATSGKQKGAEGCLSLPKKYGEVCRPARVTVRYTDREGKEQTLTGEGLLARAIFHETDHLDGKIFSDLVVVELVSDE